MQMKLTPALSGSVSFSFFLSLPQLPQVTSLPLLCRDRNQNGNVWSLRADNILGMKGRISRNTMAEDKGVRVCECYKHSGPREQPFSQGSKAAPDQMEILTQQG